MFSSAILVMLALYVGFQRAVYVALAALLLFGLGALIGGNAPEVVAVSMALTWLPGLLLAAVLTVTRSLTLSIQLSVLLAVALMVGFFLVVSDPGAFWSNTLNQAAAEWEAREVPEMANLITQMLPWVDFLTMLLVAGLWVVHVGTFVIGYGLYRQLPDARLDFGRFSDLDLGKVLAGAMAVLSLAATPLDAVWLSNIAFFLYVVFWLQGLAVLHGLSARKTLPPVVLMIAYAGLLFLPTTVIVMLVLALVGYVDVWFRLRRQPAKTE